MTTKSERQTQALGQKIGKLLKGGEMLELTGDLGSGKTTFIKGLARGMGITQPISSPTFTISRVYEQGQKRLYHFDFYRIDASDIVALELDEAASDSKAVVVVEWAENAGDALPKDRLIVRLSATGQEIRQLQLSTSDKKYQLILEKL